MAGNIPVRHYKTSEILSRFTKLAQTSQYYVHLVNETVAGGQTNAGAPPFSKILTSFGVDPAFVSSDIGMYCNEASLPGNSFATTEMTTDFPGVSQKFPYRKIYNDLQLTFYVDSSYKVIRFFESWMSYIASPYGNGSAIHEENGQRGSFRFNYPSAYKCNFYIAKFNKDEGLYDKISYRFINAFPIDITSMPVSYDSSDILKCSVSFSYDRYVFDRVGSFVPSTIPPASQQEFGVDTTGLDINNPLTDVPPGRQDLFINALQNRQMIEKVGTATQKRLLSEALNQNVPELRRIVTNDLSYRVPGPNPAGAGRGPGPIILATRDFPRATF